MELFLTCQEGKKDEEKKIIENLGDWLVLDDFADAEDMMDYINEAMDQFERDDPAKEGEVREPIFASFFEIPHQLHKRNVDLKNLELIFKLKDYMESKGLENLKNEGDNLLGIWNEYCEKNNYPEKIYSATEFAELLPSDSEKAFRMGIRAAVNKDITLSDKFMAYDSNMNVRGFKDPSDGIEKDDLINWVINNL